MMIAPARCWSTCGGLHPMPKRVSRMDIDAAASGEGAAAEAGQALPTGWELAVLDDPCLSGWVQAGDPLMVPSGTKVTILDAVEMFLPSPYEGEEHLTLRLRVEPPGQPPMEPVYYAGYRRPLDLSALAGLAEYIEAADMPSRADHAAHFQAVIEGSDIPRWGGAGGPALGFWAALGAADLVREFRRVSADAALDDDQVVPYHPEIALRGMELAYRVGRAVRSRELASRTGKSGGEARGRQLQAKAEAWKTGCRIWAQQLVDAWTGPLPPTKTEIADRIRERWADRPFEGGPRRLGGAEEPPAHETLVNNLIPSWKRQGLTGMRS